MAHLAKRKLSRPAAASRLVLELLESRMLLSANFVGYGHDMAFVTDYEAPRGESHERYDSWEASYAPPHRGEGFRSEFTHEPAAAIHSPRGNDSFGEALYSGSYADDPERLSNVVAPSYGGGQAQAISAPAYSALTTVIVNVKPTYYGPMPQALTSAPVNSSLSLVSTVKPVTSVNLADAKAQLDASRSSISSATSRTFNTEAGSAVIETAFSRYATIREAADVRRASADTVAAKEDGQSIGKQSDDAEGFVALGESSEARPVNGKISLQARRAAVDAALRELSRLRDGGGHWTLQGIAGKGRHRGKRADEATAAQQKTKPGEANAAAGMVLLRADLHAAALSADPTPPARPAIQAMIGAYRALDLGTDEAPAHVPAAPISSTPLPSHAEFDAALSQPEHESGRRGATKAAGLALAAGAITMAVRHEVLAKRPRRGDRVSR